MEGSVKEKLKDAFVFIKYGTPLPIGEPIRLNQYFQEKLTEFRQNGCITIDQPEFPEVADYVDEFYFQRAIEASDQDFFGLSNGVDRGLFMKSNFKPNKQGAVVNNLVSFRDTKLFPVTFNPQIIGLICKYLGRQAYIRNSIGIQQIDFPEGGVRDGNSNYHVDHFRQVSIMFLVDGTSEEETHLVFKGGSHRRPMFREGVETPFQMIRDRKWAERFPEKIRGVGPKGRLVIFDSSGYHMANYVAGSTRKVMFMNFTSGHNLYEFVEPIDFLSEPAFTSQPQYMKRALRAEMNFVNKFSMSRNILPIPYKVQDLKMLRSGT